MSRTFRKQPTWRGSATRQYVERVRDGYRDLGVELARDDRVTGLREHRDYRRRTRRSLRLGEYSAVLAGKKRRYGDRYGEYEL